MLLNNYSSLYKATIISVFTAIIIAGFSFIIGKENLLLLLNKNLGKFGDFFFNYATYIGDGIVWALFGIYFLIFERKRLPLILLTILISTIFVHTIKGHLIVPNFRPIEVFASMLNQVHTINGVEVHYGGSFPSGHTTQAFSMYLLCCLFSSKKWMIPVGYFLAILVGYSRVYQAQHFPIDVAGGIIVAIISVLISLQIVKKFQKNNYS